jgi:hypothetical protein
MLACMGILAFNEHNGLLSVCCLYYLPDFMLGLNFGQVNLEFQLGEDKTIVTSKIAVSPGTEGNTHPFISI